MVKKISSQQGLLFGVVLLGQVTGILVATAAAGFLADALLDTRPLGIAIAVVVGSVWASVVVLTKVVKEMR